MSTSPSEPPPKHVKLRYRALAYVRRFGRHHQAPRPKVTSQRSFADTGGARSPIHLTGQRRFSDSGGPRPVVQLNSKRSFADSNGARPVIRVASKRSFADSTGSNSGIKVLVRQSNMISKEVNSVSEETFNTRSRRTSRARKGVRKNRENRGKRRHRFLSSLHNHGGHRFRLFCGCCVEQEVVNPAESSSFHWGVGFDDSYYQNSSQRRLSNSTRFRLELCGLHVNTRSKEPLGYNVDISSVGARAASESGFGFTCASPVSCPPPLGLAPARQLSTTLQLRARDGTGSGKYTLHSGHSAFSSTGFKRKASRSYPSYTPNTPPSPFMNDFVPAGTFNNTRARSRVSVGCNGWLLNDDDPSIVGWHRRRSSGEGNPPPITTHLPHLNEGSQENEADFDRELSPKRYKKSYRASGTTSGVSSYSSPSLTASVVTSPKPPLVPRPTSCSPANSRGSRVSIVLLSQDGSISSSNGGLTDSGTAVVPLPPSPLPPSSRFSYAITPPPPFASSRSSYSSSLASQTYDSALQWKGDSGRVESGDYELPTKRRRSTGSSSNSSGGFGFGNLARSLTDEVESHHIDERLSTRERTSFVARFSASLRLTRSHSPRTLKEALSPGPRRRKDRRNRSHSASRSRSRRMFPKSSKSKSASPPPTPVKKNSRPSIVFIDCPP